MALFNITRKLKSGGKMTKLDYMQWKWLPINDETICPNVLTEEGADFYINAQAVDKDKYYYFKTLNTVRQRKCKIAWYTEHTGTNADLNEDYHKGFTIGKGKTLYWSMIWHKSGNVTVFTKEMIPRYLSGDAEITIHFK